MITESIISCVRIKPLSSKDEEISCVKFDEKSVLLLKTSEKYNFEMVFDEKAKNEEIFSNLCKRLVDEAFHGINTCIFAYGQTSSGKTFTMKGNEENPGLIPSTISYIFKRISENKDYSVEVRVSYLEIYNETINDLLKKDNNNLDVRENLARGIYIQNLSELPTRTEVDALENFYSGENLRKIGETSLNEESSRSHTVFRLHLEIRMKERPEKTNFAVINLVDLAGSEGVSKAKTEGMRKKEGANINKSLLALSTVISKLSLKDNSYINYRDSKLTRLLQPCLGGNSRTAVICTINPLMTNISETINTLKFGMNAGVIKNQIKMNERDRFEKASIEKFSVEKGLFDQALKENNELKVEMQRYDEQVTSLSERAVNLEKNKDELLEKINSFNTEAEILRTENKNLKLNNEILSSENENLRRNNQDLMKILKEFKEIEKQNFSYGNLQKRVLQIEEEKSKLENELQNLKADLSIKQEKLMDELKIKEQKIKELCEENKNLKFSKDLNSNSFLAETNFPKKLNASNIIEKPKQIFENKENINQMNHDNLNSSSFFKENHENSLRLKISKRTNNENPQRNEMSLNFEDNLENLELTSSLTAKIFQKNRILNHLSEKLFSLEKVFQQKDDIIFELKNELLYYKNLSGPNGSNPNFTAISIDEGNISNSIIKKKKIDDWSIIQKKVQCSPDKDELKKEIRYLDCKNRNFERLMLKKKQLEAENYKRIEFLNQKNQSLANMLEEKYFNVENLLDL